MKSSQFLVLFRVFLMRVVDLEIIADDADPVRLLGQFAALFAAISLLFTLPILVAGGFDSEFTHTAAHFLIASTMLVVGLLSILNWDAASPDRTDVMILSPLPVPSGVIFLAKISALACPIGLAVLMLNVFSGLLWPLYFISPDVSFGLLRSFAAYWITTLLAACLMFFFVLALQGIASQILPYQIFLRISTWIQMIGFCLFLGTYILEPSLESPSALAANPIMLQYLPSYWLWGLFQHLSGLGGPSYSIYNHLADRGWIALALTSGTAAVTWALSYRNSLRKIIEEPTIVTGLPRFRWPAILRDSLFVAIASFCLNTLMRSRFHRMILSFYLGAGLALVLVYINVLALQHPNGSVPLNAVNPAYLGASLLIMLLAIAGVAILTGIPVGLKANWVFRMTRIHAPDAYLRATRKAMHLLTLIPIWLALASLFLSLWPWRLALAHLCLLLLVGSIVIEASLHRFRKIPFTCSYMPGKGNLQFVFWAFALILLPLIHAASRFEFKILAQPIKLCATLLCLSALLVAARRYNAFQVSSLQEIQFDEVVDPEVLSLHLDSSKI